MNQDQKSKYKYTSEKGPGYFILTFDDNDKMTNAFSNMENSIKIWKSGLRWTGYCAELDITSYGIDGPSAYKATQKSMNLWTEKCIKNGILEKELLELGFKKESINGTS